MYTFLDLSKRSRSIIAILGLMLFFAPKINIISLSVYEGAGIRVDDLLLFGLFGLVALLPFAAGNFRISRFEIVFLGLLCVFFLSYLLNAVFDRGSAWYVVRHLEYFMFFYVGVAIGDSDKLMKVFFWWVGINFAIMTLQSLGLIGGMADGAYHAQLPRATGLTNGAYEGSMVVALTFALYCGLHGGKSLTGLVAMFLVSAAVVLMSAARMPMLVILLVFALALWQRHVVWRLALIGGTAAAVLAVIAAGGIASSSSKTEFEDQGIETRVLSLMREDTISVALRMVDIVRYDTGQFTNADAKIMRDKAKTYESTEADLSLLRRLGKWTYAAKTFVHQAPVFWALGLGPGVWGNALDGGLLRILTECGLIGLALFLALYLVRPRMPAFDPSRLVFLAFFIGNIAIDYYLSYKVMACILMIVGAVAAELCGRISKERDAGGMAVLPGTAS